MSRGDCVFNGCVVANIPAACCDGAACQAMSCNGLQPRVGTDALRLMRRACWRAPPAHSPNTPTSIGTGESPVRLCPASYAMRGLLYFLAMAAWGATQFLRPSSICTQGCCKKSVKQSASALTHASSATCDQHAAALAYSAPTHVKQAPPHLCWQLCGDKGVEVGVC